MFKLPTTIADTYSKILWYLFVGFFSIAVISKIIFADNSFPLSMFIGALASLVLLIPPAIVHHFEVRQKEFLLSHGKKLEVDIITIKMHKLINFGFGAPRHPYYLLCEFSFNDKHLKAKSEFIWKKPDLEGIDVFAYVDTKTLRSIINFNYR